MGLEDRVNGLEWQESEWGHIGRLSIGLLFQVVSDTAMFEKEKNIVTRRLVKRLLFLSSSVVLGLNAH